MKFTCIAHCTQTPIYTNIFVRIDDVNTCPLLVKPLDTGGFHSQRNNDAGLLYSYSCLPEQTIELTFDLLVVWDTIILISTNEISIDFIFVWISTVYILSPTTKFLAYHDAYLRCPCMKADGQTDRPGETDNQYTPIPILRRKRYSHRCKWYFVLVLLNVQFLEKNKRFLSHFWPTIVFGYLR